MAIDYGTDTACVDDVGLRDTLVTGRRLVANALARRLGTPRGALAEIGDDPDYGLDVRLLIGANLGQADERRWESDIARECEKDPRVASAATTLTFEQATHSVTITIEIDPADDAAPFPLVISVDALTVDVLSV
jgi:hypothetical protein